MNETNIEKFNAFIKKWCPEHYPHLIDTDENDGEEFRNLLRNLIQEEKISFESLKLMKERYETKCKECEELRKHCKILAYESFRKSELIYETFGIEDGEE